MKSILFYQSLAALNNIISEDKDAIKYLMSKNIQEELLCIMTTFGISFEIMSEITSIIK